MTENRDVWVFIEQNDGHIASVSLELLGKGRELAQTLGSQLVALLCGHGVSDLAQTALHAGADHVLLADHPELEHYRTLPYSRVASDLVREHRPYIFLIGATPNGRDLAPRIASAVHAGLTADCTDLQIGDYLLRKDNRLYKDLLYQIRPAFGGNLIATIVNPDTRPQMATVREGVMRPLTPDPARTGTVEPVSAALPARRFCPARAQPPGAPALRPPEGRPGDRRRRWRGGDGRKSSS